MELFENITGRSRLIWRAYHVSLGGGVSATIEEAAIGTRDCTMFRVAQVANRIVIVNANYRPIFLGLEDAARQAEKIADESWRDLREIER